MLSLKRLENEVAAEKKKYLLRETSVGENRNFREKWEYRDAYLFWLRQRAFPNDTINWLAYVRAFAQQSLMPWVRFRLAPAAPGLPPKQPPHWEFLGPSNLPVPYRQYYGQGFTSGRVNGVAVDPTDERIIYLASAGGGLWKTQDKGKTWKALGDLWDNTKVSSVAVDPTAHSTVYVGTGDFDGGAGVYGFGVMKSTDQGASWTNLARRELQGFSVRRILIDPDDSRIVTVAAGRNPFRPGRLLRSANGGTNWNPVSEAAPADWEDLKCGAKMSDGGRLCFAVGSSNGGEVLRTSDRGVHWVKLSPPLKAVNQVSLAVATSPTSPKTVYLLSGTDKSVLISTDGGDRWADTTNNLPNGNEIDADYNW